MKREINPGLLKGFNRFRFGFAETGESMCIDGRRLCMVGNFERKHLADAAAEENRAQVNPYLNGKLARGWAVYTNAPILPDRVFAGVFSTGISYADKEIERDGDYKKLAFLPFGSLDLEVRKDCPKDLLVLIAEHAHTIQSMRGQQFEISISGQTVMLGESQKVKV